MKKHWKEIDLSSSANPTYDIWIHLYDIYQCEFNKNQIEKLIKPTMNWIQLKDNLIKLDEMHEQLEEDIWQENVEKEEQSMVMKENNEHYDYPGYCNDWDSDVNEAQYGATCLICNNDFEDGDEFLELPCTHVFHTSCIMT